MRGSHFFKRILRDNRGATAIEYGLILALICIAMLVSLQSLATAITTTWAKVDTTAGDAMDNAMN